MESIKKTHFFLALLLLILTSCSSGTYNPERINVYVGTKGVEIEFIGDSPPREVYENTDFPLAVFISNKGTFSLDGETYKGLLSYTYDPFYFRPTEGTSSSDELEFALEGKSYLAPDGFFETKILPIFRVKPIEGQRESPRTELFVSVCYPYRTKLTDEVCIDTSHLTQDARERVCETQDKLYTGQGAPVAVTNVEVEMQATRQVMQPSLLIKIENKGSGMVLAPVTELELPKACELQKDTDKKGNWNQVKVTAHLSNSKLSCFPETVNLRDEKGFTRCTLPANTEFYGGSLNYHATMVIDLDYVYLTSISKEIEIIRSGLPPLEPLPGSSCKYWETDFNGECVSNCDLCARGVGFSFCGTIADAGWGCDCNAEECVTQVTASTISNLLEPLNLKSGNCIFGPGLCELGKFCCVKQ
ncbi:hypothetical protein HQ533_02645 [Candidatus Woesearchaeota archaeon]|nr:hypothetical protein [Candidatus Woesearchaeota archaeon]